MFQKRGVIIGVFIFVGLGLLVGTYFSYQLKLKGKEIVEVSFSEQYQEEGAEGQILFLSLHRFIKKSGDVNTQKIGTYEIQYTLPFKEVKRKVIVKDTKAPDLKLKGSPALEVSVGGNYEEEGYEAVDDVDGDVSSKVVVTTNVDYNTLGTYEILYEVEDQAKNKTTLKRVITIKDDTFPNLELYGSSNVNISLGDAYKEEGYTAFDNVDGNITKNVKVMNHVNNSKIGVYDIIYEVEDSSGNKVTKKRIVHVNKKENLNEFTYIRGILLVNKTHSIPSTYNPGVNIDAGNALKVLQENAQKAGHHIPLVSGFRSYTTQEIIYNNYVKRDGKEKADTYSARPGTSEHQTGLGFDVGAIDNHYGETDAGKWLAENAHLYGFIIRYPKGKEHITGYQYEPWHIRYLGTEIASDIYQKGVTLEEYLGV